jgi:hypothetical protein
VPATLCYELTTPACDEQSAGTKESGSGLVMVTMVSPDGHDGQAPQAAWTANQGDTPRTVRALLWRAGYGVQYGDSCAQGCCTPAHRRGQPDPAVEQFGSRQVRHFGAQSAQLYHKPPLAGPREIDWPPYHAAATAR